MSKSTITSQDWDHDSMAGGRGGSKAPTRQIDPGTYLVKNKDVSTGREQEVGMVFVEGDGVVMVEHYVLEQAYRSPAAEQSMVVMGTEEWFSNRRDFFAAMRERLAGKPIKYIRCTAEYSDAIPEL